MAPRARSTPAVSTAMVSALDALSSVLVAEHPRREARGLDRVVGTERGPVDVASGIGRPAAAPFGLGEHLPSARDPHPELLRPQVHPAARRRVAWIGAGAPASGDDHGAAAVQPLAVRRQDRDPDRKNMAPERAI